MLLTDHIINYELPLPPQHIDYNNNKYKHNMPFLRPFLKVFLGELVLSQMRDLLEQPLDFYELDVLLATQPTGKRRSSFFDRLSVELLSD